MFASHLEAQPSAPSPPCPSLALRELDPCQQDAKVASVSGRRLWLGLFETFLARLRSLALLGHACHVTVRIEFHPFGALFEGLHAVFVEDHLVADIVIALLVSL